MDEILNKLNQIELRLNAIEQTISPLSLLNAFDGYSDMGNQYWLVGALQDLKRQSEVTRQANGDYLDLRNKEEYDFAKSESDTGFTPSEELLNKLLTSSTGIIVNDYLRKEMDEIRSIYFEMLNGKISLNECRKMAEGIESKRPKKISFILRSPEFYTHLDTEDALMQTIQKYTDERLEEEQKRWDELKSPEERKNRVKRYEENIR